MTELTAVSVHLGETRVIQLLDALDSWALNVLRFHRELGLGPDAPDAYGADDYVGALFGRDRIERALSGTFAGREGPAALEIVDEFFRGFTVPDSTKLLRHAGNSDDRDPWWWQRVPLQGPVVEELRAREQN